MFVGPASSRFIIKLMNALGAVSLGTSVLKDSGMAIHSLESICGDIDLGGYVFHQLRADLGLQLMESFHFVCTPSLCSKKHPA